MSRESKRAARLASHEARILDVATAFVELNIEANAAIWARVRTDPATNQHAPMVVMRALAAIIESCGLGINNAEDPHQSAIQRFREFMQKLPDDSRTTANFQASCLLLKEMLDLLLAVSREQAPAETDVLVRKLMRRLRPVVGKSSGFYSINDNGDEERPRKAAAAAEVRDIRRRISSLPPPVRTSTITALLKFLPKKGT